MPKYIVKSVSLDEDVHNFICDTVDGKEEDKKNFSRAFNYSIHELIALKEEITRLKTQLKMSTIDNDVPVNISNN